MKAKLLKNRSYVRVRKRLTIFYENSEFCDLQNFRTVFLKTWVKAQVLSEFDI